MYGNSYYGQQQRFQPIMNAQMPTPNYMVPQIQTSAQFGLLGKSVDNIEVVKATDIPLDGSICYFPLTDGSAIVSKRLQSDGTSKTIIYRPVEEKDDAVKYMTLQDFETAISELDISDFKELRDLKNDFKKIKEEINELKSKKK